MSNPDFPSCLLPSAKNGWGHAECSSPRRPDGSCKIEQLCLLKHQLFSKISISSRLAASLPMLRARAIAGKRCRLCSAAGATCQPRSCEKLLRWFRCLGYAAEMPTLVLLAVSLLRAPMEKASSVARMLAFSFGCTSQKS